MIKNRHGVSWSIRKELFDMKSKKNLKKSDRTKPSRLNSQKRFHNIREMLDSVCKESAQKPSFYIKSGARFRSITYARLRADIRSLGASLSHRGLSGKKIILIGDNSYQWALTYLTALCGLGVIIPVDKDAPEEDICEIAKISAASAVIYSTEYESKANALPKKLQRISFDEINLLCEHGMSYSDSELRDFDSISIDSDLTATILFTKGTTGRAKGVMLSQRNLCASIEGLSLSLPEENDGIVLSLLPLHYAYESMVGLLAPLSKGSAVAFTESIKSTMQDAKELSPTSIISSPSIIERAYKKIWANIAKRGIEEKVKSLIRVTDSIKIASLRQAAKRKCFADIHNAFGSRLEFIVLGGAAADPEVISGMQAFGFSIIQTYGLTESTALAAITPVGENVSKSIGSAFPIGELKIAEADSNGIGEICYRGDNVMLGYYKEDELNKEVKQNGWIRTGDLGSLDNDGYLSVVGRKKNVITVSQNRAVYPEELENLLFRNPYVKECAVIGINNAENGSTDVVAIISPDITYAREILGVYSSRPMIKEKLSSAISEINTKLPQYKRIAYFVLLDEEIPKNAYKKVERSTLGEYVISNYLKFE